MYLAELKTLLEQTNLPVTYSHWRKGQEPKLPYLVFIRTDSETTGSDYANELRRDTYDIELYADTKDPVAEAALEKVLDGAGISYECYENYIDTEELYQVVYTIELYYRR